MFFLYILKDDARKVTGTFDGSLTVMETLISFVTSLFYRFTVMSPDL